MTGLSGRDGASAPSLSAFPAGRPALLSPARPAQGKGKEERKSRNGWRPSTRLTSGIVTMRDEEPCRASPNPSVASSVAATDSSPRWVPVRPPTSIWPTTSRSTVRWPSRCCIRPSPVMPPFSSGFGPRPGWWRPSTIRTSWPSTTGARTRVSPIWCLSIWPEAVSARSTTPGCCSPRSRPPGSASRRRSASTTPTAGVWSTGTSNRPTSSSTVKAGCGSPTSAWPGPWPRRRGPSRKGPSSVPPATPRPSRSKDSYSTASRTSTPLLWSFTRD